MKPLFLVVLIFSSLSSCISPVYNRLVVEDDIVKNTRKIKKSFYYPTTLERNSELDYIHQTILKEINANGKVQYTFFDRLNFFSDVYNLENEIIPIQIERYESNISTNISEDTSSILTADSTKVTVITGYSQDQTKIEKIKYTVSPRTIEKIQNSNNLKFRYYSGPNSITIQLKKEKLGKLKELISMN